MGEVIQAAFITTLNTDPHRALQGALEKGMSEVVIIGRDKDGEFYFASSQADSGEVVWFLQRAQWELFKMEDRIREEGDPRGRPRRGS
jgi:hypothetical protein